MGAVFCSSHVQSFLAAPPSGKPIVNHWESHMPKGVGYGKKKKMKRKPRK